MFYYLFYKNSLLTEIECSGSLNVFYYYDLSCGKKRENFAICSQEIATPCICKARNDGWWFGCAIVCFQAA